MSTCGQCWSQASPPWWWDFSGIRRMLFARPWMVAMGYDPDDKARMEEMQKSAGKSYAISFVASLVSAFVLGKIIHDHHGE